ncbi:MAG TPA: metallophosphoesterase [Pirellulales bacterium]|nr:metallophosphoesterase [Pirellulales bacterium]
MISRRRFVQATAATASLGTGLGIYTWQIEPHWLEIVRRPLPIANLPPELRGRTLLHLSDLHVGPQVSDAYIARVFETVRSLAPDIVVYTGDFTSRDTDVEPQVSRVYADCVRGRLGTIGVLGNHDYGMNWSRPEIALRLTSILGDCGIHILRNEVAEIAGLQFAGMDDLWAGHFACASTLAGLAPSKAAIVLSHNPDSVDKPGWDGYEGWILSGHTHGGQCKPPFLPPPLLPVRNRRYTSGVFELTQNRRLYISRGVGHLLQVRFNVRPEATLFELQAA